MTKKEFQSRIHGWIQNEKEFLEEWKSGEIPKNRRGVCNVDSVLERIEFNVMDAFYAYVYPEQCPECSRTGHDHDGECSHFDDKNLRGRDKWGVDANVLK